VDQTWQTSFRRVNSDDNTDLPTSTQPGVKAIQLVDVAIVEAHFGGRVQFAAWFEDALYKGRAVFIGEQAQQLTDRVVGRGIEVFLASTGDASN